MKKFEDMAYIPYIAHKRQMCKLYERINQLKLALVLSNILWAVAVSVCYLTR